MEPLLAAARSSAALRTLLQEAAALQACGRCCLRLAGVRSAEAYMDGSLPSSGAQVLDALQLHGQEGDAADADAAGGPSKRPRVEAAGQTEQGAGASCAAATFSFAEAAPGSQDQQPAVCPLCLGLLQLPELTRSCGGSGCGKSSSCPLQLVTTVSTLNDPARYASLNWGASVAAQAVADNLPAGDGQVAAAAEGEADGGAPAGNNSMSVQRQAAAVADLAAAAAGIAGEFDLDSFSLEVSLPASLAVRQQALAWRLHNLGVPEGEAAAAQLHKALDVKEAARLCFAPALAAALGQPHDARSNMRIALSITHPDAPAECGWLAPSSGGGGRQWRGGGRRGKQRRQQGKGQAGQQQQQQQEDEAELPALTDAVVQRLASMPQAEFAASCPPAASQLAPPSAPATLLLQARRLPVHIGGRYLKLRRGIPQSPWFIDGARKGEGSVQEAIEQGVLPCLQADSYTFVSAGREDIDVRMLAEGRPFILEVHNARRRVPEPQELQRMEARVAEASRGGVAVHGLFPASSSQLALLKQGEQEKQKSYVAVCWLPRPLSQADVALLAGTRDLTVQQDTPIRVLHRRANLCRPKVIHELRAEALPGQPLGYFALHLRTQAGTYIKEFVHGDLGRTRPSLGDLLGCQAEIASLDVTQIHMPFGPDPAKQAA